MTDTKGVSDEQARRIRELMADIGSACRGVPNDVVASALLAMLNDIVAKSPEPAKSLEFIITTLRRAEDLREGVASSPTELDHGTKRMQ